VRRRGRRRRWMMRRRWRRSRYTTRVL